MKWYENSKAFELTKTLVESSDLSYAQISDIISNMFDVECSPEAIRKKMSRSGVKKSFIAQRFEQDVQIERMRQELDYYRKMYKGTVRMSAFEAEILDRIEKKNIVLPAVKAPSESKTPSSEKAVFLWSDWHIGETVSFESMGGLNEYNFDIFTERFNTLVSTSSNIVANKLSAFGVRDIYIFHLGDVVSGMIHDELVRTADKNVVDCIFDGAAVVAAGIRELCQTFEHVYFVGIPGNHGRFTKKKEHKDRYVNWDYVFYKTVGLMLKDQPNLTLKASRSIWALEEVAGFRFLLLHGDDIKGWSGIPWYGIDRAVSKLTALFASSNRFFDYVCLAHFHSSGTFDHTGAEIILNGSLVGGDEYAASLFLNNKPKQRIFGVHPEHGKTWEYNIYL